MSFTKKMATHLDVLFLVRQKFGADSWRTSRFDYLAALDYLTALITLENFADLRKRADAAVRPCNKASPRMLATAINTAPFTGLARRSRVNSPAVLRPGPAPTLRS
jgi:hypothetical protein